MSTFSETKDLKQKKIFLYCLVKNVSAAVTIGSTTTESKERVWEIEASYIAYHSFDDVSTSGTCEDDRIVDFFRAQKEVVARSVAAAEPVVADIGLANSSNRQMLFDANGNLLAEKVGEVTELDYMIRVYILTDFCFEFGPSPNTEQGSFHFKCTITHGTLTEDGRAYLYKSDVTLSARDKALRAINQLGLLPVKLVIDQPVKSRPTSASVHTGTLKSKQASDVEIRKAAFHARKKTQK